MPLRILQICNKPPLPPRDGGCLAMLRMTEGLLQLGCTVHVLAIETEKHPFTKPAEYTELIRRTSMDAVFVNTSVRWLPAFLSLFKTSSYNIDRFYSMGFESRLISQLAQNEYDIVQLESLYVAPYIPAIRRMSKAKIVLRAHNTESEIWKKYAEKTQDALKKIWFRDLASKLEIYERKALDSVDAVVPITREDESRLKKLANNTKGFHTATYALNDIKSETGQPEAHTVFHIGAMDWKPNYDGVEWLCNEVWPIVLKSVPQATLHLAGKSLDAGINFGKQIRNHGEVESASEFISRYQIMAVPLHSGGGVKVKVIEGLFSGKPIVTTRVGAEGIACTNGIDIAIAESTEEFAHNIVELLNNSEKAAAIGKAGKKTAAENHELGRVTEKLCDFYSTLIRS
jgi:polysaccharide biosynthesis protein PslH